MIVLVAAAVLLAGAEWARRNGRRLRLAQARYRIGRLAGPTRGDFLLSEGLPIVDDPGKPIPPVTDNHAAMAA